jgi:TPR repeat protein
LFRLAADQGHATAQVNLAAMYFKGQGMSQDYTGCELVSPRCRPGNATASSTSATCTNLAKACRKTQRLWVVSLAADWGNATPSSTSA